MADRLGVPFNEKVNQRLRGVSRRVSLEIILGEQSNDNSDKEKLALAEEKNNIYKRYIFSMTPGDLFKDVRMTFHTLRQRGYFWLLDHPVRIPGRF